MTSWSTPRIVVAQALCFGLLTGLCEAVLIGIKHGVLGHIVRTGPDIVWMAPVVDAVLFFVIGLLLIGGARVWRPLAEPWISTFVFAFFAYLSLLLMYHPIQMYARVVLAVGLAVQSARPGDRWQGFRPFVNRSLIALTAAVALLAMGVRVTPWLDTERHLAELPAPPTGHPMSC